MKTSYSKLSTFLTCPRKFKYQYLEESVRDEVVPVFVIGEAMHDFVEQYSIDTIHNKVKNNTDYEQRFLDKMKILNLSLEEQEHYRKFIPKYQSQNKVLRPLELNGVIFTERFFSYKLRGHEITGKIDVITENLSLVDYKSASKRFVQSEVDNPLSDKGLQLSIYCLPFKMWFEDLPSKVGYQVIVKDTFKVQNIATKRTGDDLIEVEEYIVKAIDDILDCMAKNKFNKTKFDKFCYWCQFKEVCIYE
jgi:CRISPR/Cas system-associated exonuclease Cas4 (RecB family)